MKYILTLTILVLLPWQVMLSGDGRCGTNFINQEHEIAWYQMMEDFHEWKALRLTAPVHHQFIPVHIHIVNESNGFGGYNYNSAVADVQRASIALYYAGIKLYVCGISWINSDALFNIDNQTERDQLRSFNIDNVLNLYVVNEIDGANGYAYLPPNNMDNNTNNLVVRKSAMDESTLEHEFGHSFGLNHTHHSGSIQQLDVSGFPTLVGGQEFVNGSNCITAGDLLCDTPADPNANTCAFGCVSIPPACDYIGVVTDPNGDSYSPHVENYMSYSPGGCRFEFKQDQLDLMRFVVNNVFVAPDNEFSCANCSSDPEVFPNGNQFGEYWNHNTLTSSSNLTGLTSVTIGPVLRVYATEKVTLTPGFAFNAANPVTVGFHALIDPCPAITPQAPPGNADEEELIEAVLIRDMSVAIYPNPFKSETTIELQVANQEERVTVEIYDLVGKRVAQLANNETLTTGIHKLTFNSAEHAGNFFICRVKIGSQEFTEKIVKME